MTDRPVVQVARDVFVLTSSLYETTSTIIRRERSALLVDPAWTVEELDDIARWLTENDCRVTCGFASHAHTDHMLWHPAFGDAPRWASPKSVEMAACWRDEMLPFLEHYPDEWPNPFESIRPFDGQTIPAPFGSDGTESIKLLVHDGHAPGHTAILLADRGVLLAGDMLSDVELPLPFSPDDLPVYLDALDRLTPVVTKAAVLIPGHGRPTDRPLARLDADRRLPRRRDRRTRGGRPPSWQQGNGRGTRQDRRTGRTAPRVRRPVSAAGRQGSSGRLGRRARRSVRGCHSAGRCLGGTRRCCRRAEPCPW